MTAQDMVQRIVRGLTLSDDVEVIEVKPNAALVQVDSQKLMIGVRECK